MVLVKEHVRVMDQATKRVEPECNDSKSISKDESDRFRLAPTMTCSKAEPLPQRVGKKTDRTGMHGAWRILLTGDDSMMAAI